MRIFLDTSIIVKEGYFRSGTIQAFLKAAKFLDFEIFVPEVVLDELNGRVLQKISERVGAYEKAARELSALTGSDLGQVNATDEIEKYTDWLDELLDDNKVEVLPYPNTTTKELVTKSYSGLKPFKKGGEGHKDYLIWSTIQEYLNQHPSMITTILLTNNKKDFCQDDGERPALHPDLCAGIENGNMPVVFLDLGEFFSAEIVPHLQGLDIEQIPEDLTERTIEIIETDLQDYSAFGFEGVPIQNDVTITSVDTIEIDEREIRALDEDEVLVTLSGRVHVSLDGFMEKHEMYSGDHNVDVWDADWNEWVMAVATEAELPFTVNFLYSKPENDLVGYDINLPTQIDPYDY